jgi:ATP-dependent 26S proteasome regulatory subunit
MVVRRSSALYLLASLLVGGTKQTSAFQQLQHRSLSSIDLNGNLKDVRTFRRIGLKPRQSVQLYSTNGLSPPGKERPGRGGPKKRLARVVKKLINGQSRFVALFRALPKRSKRILIANMLFFAVAFGSVSRNIYYQSAPPRPVEITYSSFLDLVENQQPPLPLGSNSPTSNVPVMDQVRIGTDRIAYRLTRNVDGKPTAPEILSTNPQPKKSSSRSRIGLKKAKPAAPSPYLTAYTRKVPASPELVSALRKSDISFSAANAPRTSVLVLAIRTFMLAFYGLILFRLYQQVSGAGGGGMGGAKDTPGKLAQGNDLPLASFEDIQGIDQAKVEVMELVDALRNPDKYAILGARAPTGLLLEGPPGTGKTMLARATAASAGVPLIYCSGSDFVEMFVGRGAARVRKLFERADKLSPCIIFIDELDALGKARDSGSSFGGISRSNDEAEQTLNQLLTCMDGLDSSRRICVLAATNRKDVLDTALIRPGRFDRIVKLQLPDAAGRQNILRVHCTKLPGFVEGAGLDPNRPGSLGKGRVVDLSAIAAITDGFSGAELEFLVNEAAIRAVRRVSAALREGTSTKDITPHVEAADFEDSLRNFYQTRKPKAVGVGDLWKNMMK